MTIIILYAYKQGIKITNVCEKDGGKLSLLLELWKWHEMKVSHFRSQNVKSNASKKTPQLCCKAQRGHRLFPHLLVHSCISWSDNKMTDQSIVTVEDSGRKPVQGAKAAHGPLTPACCYCCLLSKWEPHVFCVLRPPREVMRHEWQHWHTSHSKRSSKNQLNFFQGLFLMCKMWALPGWLLLSIL